MSEQQDDASHSRVQPHPDDVRAEVPAECDASWELLVRTFTDAAPFTTLMDYALGMTMWTAAQDAQQVHAEQDTSTGDTATTFQVDTPMVCLVALALYSAAEQQELHEVHRVAMRPALAQLADDQQARQVATLRPGLDGNDRSGRLRDNDRLALADAVQPGNEQQWRQWRDSALHILATNIDHSSWSGMASPGPRLQVRLSQVRSMSIRRDWYEHPDQPPVTTPDDGADVLA